MMRLHNCGIVRMKVVTITQNDCHERSTLRMRTSRTRRKIRSNVRLMACSPTIASSNWLTTNDKTREPSRAFHRSHQ